jgi:thiol-disulfide isomerase/thioredoxin
VSVFENVAKAAEGVLNVAVVDISEEENSKIKEAFKITGSPTVLYFSFDKKYPINIRDYDIEIVDHKILEFLNDRIYDALKLR